METEELWKVIRDFPKYSVSTTGRVRRDESGRILAQSPNQYGVVSVGLMRGNTQFRRSVPLLVAKAFIPHPFGPFDTPINLNGNRYDNRIENLVWRPRWFAVQYNHQFKEPYGYPITRPLRDVKTEIEYENSWDVATKHGLLEKDVVLSILNNTVTWPTYQSFEVIE